MNIPKPRNVAKTLPVWQSVRVTCESHTPSILSPLSGSFELWAELDAGPRMKSRAVNPKIEAIDARVVFLFLSFIFVLNLMLLGLVFCFGFLFICVCPRAGMNPLACGRICSAPL